MTAPAKLKNLTPAEVHAGLSRGDITLIDVREPQEFAAGRIRGALNFPLSTFDPWVLPVSTDRKIVLQCGSGKRSATAVERCLEAGVKVEHHLAGGIAEWTAAGLGTTVFDPERKPTQRGPISGTDR